MINIHKVSVNIHQRADIEVRRPCMIIDANQGPRGPTVAAAACISILNKVQIWGEKNIAGI